MQDIKDHEVTIKLKNLNLGGVKLDLQRIDESHADALKTWYDLGAKEYLNHKLLHTLLAASELSRETVELDNDTLKINIPKQGIALVNLYLDTK